MIDDKYLQRMTNGEIWLAIHRQDRLEKQGYELNTLDPNIVNQLNEIRNIYQPNNMGWFRTWWQKIKSKRDIDFLQVLTQQEKAILEHGRIIEEAARKKELEERNYHKFVQEYEYQLLEIQAKTILLQEATDRGLTVELYLEAYQKELMIKMELAAEERRMELGIKDYAARTRIDLDAERERADNYFENYFKKLEVDREDFEARTEIERNDYEERTRIEAEDYERRIQVDLFAEKIYSQIRVKEHGEKSDIDYKRTLQEREDAIRLSILSEDMPDYQKVILVQELLDVLYEQIEEIDQRKISPTLKAQMITDRMSIIATLKEDRDARQNRLLQEVKRQDF